jgi:hypothetical protein
LTNVLHISDLQWTKEFLLIPGSKKHYSLHHLYISTDAGFYAAGASDASVEDEKSYQLKHHRTNELICQILVSPHEVDEYRAFENQLLTSRLR